MPKENGSASGHGADAAQVRKAVKALLKYIGNEKASSNNLFDDDEMLNLVIALKKIPEKKRNDKPIRLPLPHPIYTTDGIDVCLIVKDHKGEGHKEAKKRVLAEGGAGVAKVIGISKLKTKYESYESKRQLCDSYDFFVADERIIPSLPKLLGKTFFKKKKQPVPVKLTGKDWAGQIRKACEATYMFYTGGSSLNIRVARSSQSEDQCVENIMEAIEGAATKVPGQWKGIKALYLKSTNSVALPIYQTLHDKHLDTGNANPS